MKASSSLQGLHDRPSRLPFHERSLRRPTFVSRQGHRHPSPYLWIGCGVRALSIGCCGSPSPNPPLFGGSVHLIARGTPLFGQVSALARPQLQRIGIAQPRGLEQVGAFGGAPARWLG